MPKPGAAGGGVYAQAKIAAELKIRTVHILIRYFRSNTAGMTTEKNQEPQRYLIFPIILFTKHLGP